MQKPNGYDEAKAQGEFVPVELGGHKMTIMEVTEQQSKGGDNMIVVKFDFSADDSQPSYFAEQYKNDTRSEKKWSNQATQYIMVNDYQDKSKTSSAFKTFTTCVEHSNPGFETKWGIEKWGAQFKGKKIGGVFGEQLDFYNGQEKKKRVLRWFCSIDKVAEAEIPDLQESKAYKNRPQTSVSSDGFMNIPDALEDELPFN